MLVFLIFLLASYKLNSLPFQPIEFSGFNQFWASTFEAGSYFHTSMVILPAGLKSYSFESKVREFFVSLSYLDLGTLKITDPYGETIGEERPGVLRTSLGIHLSFANGWRGFFSSYLLRVFQRDLNVNEFWADWGILSPPLRGNYIAGTAKIGTSFELGLGLKGVHYLVFISGSGLENYTISASTSYGYQFFYGTGGFYFERYSLQKVLKPFVILSFLPSKRFQVEYFYRYEPILPDVFGFGLYLR